MSKNTLYLKYRPFQLNDVVGQGFVIDTLKQSSVLNRFVHAYLFGGVKGSGKTTVARILSNLITCENVKDGILCGKCLACNRIHNGTALDIVELDGAKNGNVENIQELIESARWSPTELRKKVYIIDEAQELSSKAISALLKIVEEPPEYVTFIFCTTKIEKIPDTILSRSQRFIFNRIALNDVVKRLKYISEKENIKIDDGALYGIAKIGRGSMRDSIMFLEQISILTNNNIDESLVYKYYGMVDRKGVYNIVRSLVECNIITLMDQINDLVISNIDVKNILYEISEVFRNIMVIKAQNGSTKLIELPEHEIQFLLNIGASLKFSQIEKLTKVFSNIDRDLDYSINKRWVLESTLLRCASYLKQQ